MPAFADPSANERSGEVPRSGSDENAGETGALHRVLVVEDEWFIAMETDAVLRGAGYAVVGIAATAEDAVALAGRERPDLVVMDIRLRGARDGIDAALEIHERFGISCIFATAHTEAHMRDRGAAAQPRAWLTKPFSDQQLLRAVRTALVRLG